VRVPRRNAEIVGGIMITARHSASYAWRSVASILIIRCFAILLRGILRIFEYARRPDSESGESSSADALRMRRTYAIQSHRSTSSCGLSKYVTVQLIVDSDRI